MALSQLFCKAASEDKANTGAGDVAQEWNSTSFYLLLHTYPHCLGFWKHSLTMDLALGA